MKVTLKSDRTLKRQEHEACEKLSKAGFLIQGYDFIKKQLCIFKRTNEHTNNEKTKIYYFDSYIDAVKGLLPN